jgi:hypothetical protein
MRPNNLAVPGEMRRPLCLPSSQLARVAYERLHSRWIDDQVWYQARAVVLECCQKHFASPTDVSVDEGDVLHQPVSLIP